MLVGGSAHGIDPGNSSNDADTDGDTDRDTEEEGDTATVPVTAPIHAELWYSVGHFLVYIELAPATGLPLRITKSELYGDTDILIGSNAITMLRDGSLVGTRLQVTEVFTTQIYRIPSPPRDGSLALFEQIGIMPDNIALEALYTDCDGRLYAMDTGEHEWTVNGNRPIRFNGDFLAGVFTFDIVSDFSTATMADIDDMAPGIDAEGAVIDNPGFAIDSEVVYIFDFETSMGEQVGEGGDWGIHALGGTLFDDGISRLYLLSQDAELLLMDPSDYSVSEVLIQGPQDVDDPDATGHSGLAGPLTPCETRFVPAV